MKSSHYDVIIIGSGIGGLTCGALLAKHGRNVLMLEQHSKPGGYVTSYSRQGFLFDVVHLIGGLKKGAPVERVFSHLGVDRSIDFIEVEKVFRFIYPDRTVEFHSDPAAYRQELIRHFPHEADNIERYFRVQEKIWNEILDSDYDPNILQLMTYPIRFPNLVRYQNKTFGEFLAGFFKDAQIREVLGSGWGYLGLNNSRVSALYMVGMCMSYQAGGAWYPRGGYQGLSDALTDCFREQGGTLRLKSGVKKIIIENNRAAGVELVNGERIRATSVVSNADTKKTFLQLVGEEQTGRKFADSVKALQQSVSGFVVHLGVKMDIAEELHCGCNMCFPAYGTAENHFRLAARGEIDMSPGRFGFGLSVSSLKDPALTPEGCHALDIIYMPAPYHFQNTWMPGDKQAYTALKERIAENLILAAEAYIPGISKHIVVKDVNTPLTYERYTAATEGGWYDMACTPGQSLLNRRLRKMPLKGLYLTGAKNFPGPGMFGAIQSGLFTADGILGNILTRGKYLLNLQEDKA